MPQTPANSVDGSVADTGGAGVTHAAAGLARMTPGLILGPFYPLQHAADADTRMWRGPCLPPGASPLQFHVCVATREGVPVAGAIVELWHADHAGRYPHPSAGEADAVLRGFTGYGIARTDADGRCEFDTLLPGAYRAEGTQRARHLHVQISGRFDRLVTQVFLPDDALRHEDRWYRAAARPESLLARMEQGVEAVVELHWTAVLARG